jgi:tRNA threonylcarbamoyladenosine biosynthesis protein TsaB
MLTLALETSGFGGSIALLEDGSLLGERILDSQRRHAQTLVPEIQSLLRDHARRAADCEVLAVSCGPGSFTGLRVGITCAKTMAYATGAKVAAVPTFPCIVAAVPESAYQARVQVILNAQREELFIGSFLRASSGSWIETQPLRIERADRWLETLQPEDVVTGPGVEPLRSQLSQKCKVLSQEFSEPRAVWVGRVGLELIAAGQSTTCWDLEPYYVRKSAAEEKWDAKSQLV